MSAATSSKGCRCTIVVPWFNEAERFHAAPFLKFLGLDDPLCRAVDFLFVNDGSTDDTLALLETMRRGNEDRIAILDKKVNGGKGEAIRDGMLAALDAGGAGCEYVGFWDADLATPLAAIPEFLARMETNPKLHMIFGSRVRLLGRSIHRKAARHYLGRLFATVASKTLALPIYDTQCGAKIFRATPELKEVLGAPFLSRWIFDVEIIARFIQRCGRHFCYHSIYEFPLDAWEDVGGSKLKSFDFLNAAVDMMRIRRHYLGNAGAARRKK